MTKSRPSSSRPERCQRITSSVTGRKRRCGHVGALDLGLLAQAAGPLVGARGLIAGLAGLAALEATRINIVASAKERAKQGDLGFGRGVMMDKIVVRVHRDAPTVEHRQPSSLQRTPSAVTPTYYSDCKRPRGACPHGALIFPYNAATKRLSRLRVVSARPGGPGGNHPKTSAIGGARCSRKSAFRRHKAGRGRLQFAMLQSRAISVNRAAGRSVGDLSHQAHSSGPAGAGQACGTFSWQRMEWQRGKGDRHRRRRPFVLGRR